MGFWMSTLSTSMGAFIGVLGAYFIAKWQMNKTQRLNSNAFYVRFNEAQIYINNFDNEVEEILKMIQGGMRRNARILLSKDDFVELREHIEIAIRIINPEIEEKELDDFIVVLGKINQYAPIAYYKDMNGLFFDMVYIYNSLLSECENLVMDLPKKMDIGFFNYKSLTLNFLTKKFRKKYKKMQRKLKI